MGSRAARSSFTGGTSPATAGRLCTGGTSPAAAGCLTATGCAASRCAFDAASPSFLIAVCVVSEERTAAADFTLASAPFFCFTTCRSRRTMQRSPLAFSPPSRQPAQARRYLYHSRGVPRATAAPTRAPHARLDRELALCRASDQALPRDPILHAPVPAVISNAVRD